MKSSGTLPLRHSQGSALILSLVFVAMFSTLAAAMATFSGTNVQIAENLREVDVARSCAESGLEVLRYWASKVEIPGTTAAEDQFTQLAASLQNELADAGITNVQPVLNGSTITISNVPLLSQNGQSFTAVLTKIDNDNVQVDVTGHYAGLDRTIRSHYAFGTRAHTVLDFGVASKGPVSLSGNIDLSGMTIDVESNAYIESPNALLALSIIGNSRIAGNVKIGNPLGYVYLQGGNAGIGGETGTAAMHHVEFGVPPTEFPQMNPGLFIPYATNTLSPTADLSADATFENLRIPAGRNPSFSGHATLTGVIYIETPNVVTFAGGVDITAIIVTNGNPADNSGTNRLTFSGDVTGHPVSQLPLEPQFQSLHDKTGTFILAPGFRVDFGGSFSTLCGAIAANGIELWGDAGGMIDGSIVNYADTQMTLRGNTDLYFNRSGLDKLPAGFIPEIILEYDPSSYTEVL